MRFDFNEHFLSRCHDIFNKPSLKHSNIFNKLFSIYSGHENQSLNIPQRNKSRAY